MTNDTSNQIEWREGNLPVSTRFDDPYYSRHDGRAETDHVFINGNNLLNRWPALPHCTIAELGFGTGLNFLQTTFRWLELAPKEATLQFISFEQYPMTQSEMAKALEHWNELSALAEGLTSQWHPRGEVIEIAFTQNISLIVHFGDANRILPNLKFQADGWYLDGFSPAKNPELWNENLMTVVGERTKMDGTFATYTAAGFVKRGLQSAGFDVAKTTGFGKKRDMLIGKRIAGSNDMYVANGH